VLSDCFFGEFSFICTSFTFFDVQFFHFLLMFLILSFFIDVSGQSVPRGAGPPRGASEVQKATAEQQEEHRRQDQELLAQSAGSARRPQPNLHTPRRPG
jgi:hypothetical protein